MRTRARRAVYERKKKKTRPSPVCWEFAGISGTRTVSEEATRGRASSEWIDLVHPLETDIRETLGLRFGNNASTQKRRV